MKNLLIYFLFKINNDSKMALFIFLIIFVAIAIFLYKNIAIKKIDGILTSAEEKSIMDYLPISSNNFSPLIKIIKKKIILKINCHGKTIKITEDSDDYIKKIKEKLKMKVKILYVKIKFLHINFIWSLQY